MSTLTDLLDASRARHTHLCPRQVLGVRVALAGLRLLDINPTIKHSKKLLMVISETDGCFVDGIEVAAQVSVGHRTLKIEDYGKIAATFLNLKTHQAVRLHPTLGVRELARKYCPYEKLAYFAQLKAYQMIPDCELLSVRWIRLDQDIQQLTGSPRQRACCNKCGEEIINGREIIKSQVVLCAACAGYAYYHLEDAIGAVENGAGKINTF